MTPTQAGPEGSFLSASRKEMKILQDLDQRTRTWSWTTQVSTQGHLWPQLQCLSRPVLQPLVKYANTRKEIKSCLAFPSGPVNRPNEDSSCYTVGEMGPCGPRNSSIPANVFTQHSAFVLHVLQEPPPLLSAPPEGSWLGCSAHIPPGPSEPTDSLAVWRCRPSGPSLLLTVAALQPAGVGWDRGLLQNGSQYSMLPVSGCFLSCLEMLSSRWTEKMKAQITTRTCRVGKSE